MILTRTTRVVVDRCDDGSPAIAGFFFCRFGFRLAPLVTRVVGLIIEELFYHQIGKVMTSRDFLSRDCATPLRLVT